MAKPLVPCKHCGTPFPAYPGQVLRGKKFCSRPCGYAWRNRPDVRQAQFWAQIDKDAPGGCWLWKGWLLNSGYGETTVRGKKITVHRFAYALAHGPIPKGKLLMHSCDVPTCVNPAHLSVGTDADNHRDKIAKRRHLFGERSPQAKVNEEAVRTIRTEYRCTMTGRRTDWSNAKELCDRFGIAKPTLLQILKRETWAHVK
jgi:hypothetical protein